MAHKVKHRNSLVVSPVNTSPAFKIISEKYYCKVLLEEECSQSQLVGVRGRKIKPSK